MDSDAAFEKFRECAVEVLQVPADKITKEAKFADDLDADSLDLVELVMTIEDELKIEIPDDDIDALGFGTDAKKVTGRQLVEIATKAKG